MNEIIQLNLNLEAAKATGRKLKIEEFAAGFRATFWKSKGDGVETWSASDTNLLHAIDMAATKCTEADANERSISYGAEGE